MAGIKLDTQREQKISIKANVPYRAEFNPLSNGKYPNVFQIQNYGANAVYIGIAPNISLTENYEISILGGGGKDTLLFPLGTYFIYLISDTNNEITIRSFLSDEVYSNELNRTQSTVIINNTVASDVVVSEELPAGTNNIGMVDIEAALPAGTNKIGEVDIASLPALPVGSNLIGAVDINTLPALPEGTNTIGDVGIVSIFAGANIKPATGMTIYNIPMTSADTEYSQALPAYCRKILASIQDADTAVSVRYSLVTGKVATPTAPYLQYNGGVEMELNDIELATGTLYFACSGASKVMQIICLA